MMNTVSFHIFFCYSDSIAELYNKNIHMGEFSGHGRGIFESTGLSSEERALAKEQEGELTFHKRAEKLHDYAEKLAHQARTAALVHGLMRQIGKIELLDEETCEKFALDHPQFFDEGPAVFAVAVALEKVKRSEH
jgi:hypothetical protein